ncbi:MAG TPA: polysaccharide deacetylase family protein [Vicinamibacterales bacterium]|nr:polysaccharide deacetylase family protein [Vicinamibacterales bacterium]
MTVNGCLVAMYHYVRDPVASGARLNALATADFEAQLSWLEPRRQLVDFPHFAAALQARQPLHATALLTFDDGLADHYEYVFPRLRQRRASGVFFLAGAAHDRTPRLLNVHKTHLLIAQLGADPFAAAVREAIARDLVAVANGPTRSPDVYRYDDGASQAEIKHLLNYQLPPATADRVLADLYAAHVGDEVDDARRFYLSSAAICEMSAAGMTFGFHTEQHRVLARLTESQQGDELGRGVARITELTGQKLVPFCYPYGHAHTYNATTIEVLRRAGYCAAFTTTRRVADPACDPPFEIPRLDTRDLPPFHATPADA